MNIQGFLGLVKMKKREPTIRLTTFNCNFNWEEKAQPQIRFLWSERYGIKMPGFRIKDLVFSPGSICRTAETIRTGKGSFLAKSIRSLTAGPVLKKECPAATPSYIANFDPNV